MSDAICQPRWLATSVGSEGQRRFLTCICRKAMHSRSGLHGIHSRLGNGVCRSMGGAAVLPHSIGGGDAGLFLHGRNFHGGAFTAWAIFVHTVCVLLFTMAILSDSNSGANGDYLKGLGQTYCEGTKYGQSGLWTQYSRVRQGRVGCLDFYKAFLGARLDV